MIDRKSPLLDGTFGKVLSELEEKLREAEEKAKYWQEKYDRAILEQIKLERELERLIHEAHESALRGEGNGMKFGTACMHKKEEIRHALNGEVLESWDEDGKHWTKAPKEVCDKVILGAYDSLYYQAEQLRSSSCALDKLYSVDPKDFKKYMQLVEEERNKAMNDYTYENEVDSE